MKKHNKKALFAICLVLLIAVALIFSACDQEKKTFKVEGLSMEPTLHDGDVVTIIPLEGKPKNGDIVLIGKTDNNNAETVKRVIAAEGQELKIDFENNKIYIDGQLLHEDYTQGATIIGDIPVDSINGTVPAGKVFVLGDNRTVSIDSRYQDFGLVDVESITGVVDPS